MELEGSLKCTQPAKVLILCQMHPVYIFPPYFPTIYSNIFTSTPRSSEMSLACRFSDQDFVRIYHLCHACYMFHAFRPP
jgi:hypothetical protein